MAQQVMMDNSGEEGDQRKVKAKEQEATSTSDEQNRKENCQVRGSNTRAKEWQKNKDPANRQAHFTTYLYWMPE